MVLTYFCPWTLNLHIAIVLLRLRVHYSVEIKRYKVKLEIELELHYLADYFGEVYSIVKEKLVYLFM